MKHLRLIIFMILANTALSAGIASADGGAFADENFSATIYLTTDYVSRGISFSDENPAIQGTFDYTHPWGAFVGIWASSWDDLGYSNDIELAYYAGYSGTVGGIGYTLTANYYTYPGAKDDGFEFDYVEIDTLLEYTIENTTLSPTFGLGYSYSPEYSWEDGSSHYVHGMLDLSLPKNFGLGFEVGYMDIEGNKTTPFGSGLDGKKGYGYLHWKVGLSTKLKGFGLDLSYHDTNEKDFFESFYGYNAGNSRIVFTLSRSI